MREIKFRGKRIDNGEWVYGYLFVSQMSGAYILSTQIDIKSRGSGAVSMGDKLIQYEVDPETVGQYTGIKDGNGKEIYEGDVIKGETTYPMEVLINEGLTKIKFKPERSVYEEPLFQDYIKEDELEKIGNIFDNPELMEVEQCKD